MEGGPDKIKIEAHFTGKKGSALKILSSWSMRMGAGDEKI
jgi:hypothetical protein